MKILYISQGRKRISSLVFCADLRILLGEQTKKEGASLRPRS